MRSGAGGLRADSAEAEWCACSRVYAEWCSARTLTRRPRRSAELHARLMRLESAASAAQRLQAENAALAHERDTLTAELSSANEQIASLYRAQAAASQETARAQREVARLQAELVAVQEVDNEQLRVLWARVNGTAA